MIKKINRHLLVVAFFFFLSVVFISPQLEIHSPSLIDDGSDLFKAATHSYLELFIQETFIDARIKTLLILYRKVAFDLFHLDLSLHFLLQVLFLWLTASGIYLLIKQMRMSFWLAATAGLITFILPSTVANYYRLGTSEHFQLLLVTFSLLWVKKRLLSMLLLTAACFFKENSVFFLTLPIFYSLSHKYFDKKLLVQILIFIAYCALLAYKLLYLQDNYTSQSTISLHNLELAAATSPWTFVVLLISYLPIIYRLWKQEDITHAYVYYAFFISTITFIIWPMGQMYYHLPSQGLAVICSFLIFQVMHRASKNKQLTIGIFAVLLAFFIYQQLLIAKNIGMELHQQHLADGVLSSFILKNKWADYEVYSSLQHFEANHKISMYFNEWQPTNNRPAFHPNIETWLATDFTNWNQLNFLAQKAEEDFLNSQNPKRILISEFNNTNNSNHSRIQEICGGSFLVEEACRYQVIFGEKVY